MFTCLDLDEEGLFRKSGHHDRIKQIQNLYNYGIIFENIQYSFIIIK